MPKYTIKALKFRGQWHIQNIFIAIFTGDKAQVGGGKQGDEVYL